MADICVIGAGPAGSTFAARMARLGHDVCLIEREAFPRAHVGESLSPGVLPLLDVTGARASVEAAGFSKVRNVLVKWDQAPHERHDPGPPGLLVDRGRFDQLLLEHAEALGVRVLQPATVRERRRDAAGWSLHIETQGRSLELHASFLAEAGGRAAPFPSRRRRTGCRTLALYAYWRGRTLPRAPRIEAGTDAWYWGVPLPDGSYNTLVFVDVAQFRTRAPRDIGGQFHALIERSELMAGCSGAYLASPVLAMDATPYIDEDSITPFSIKVGEAGLAIDPLSSSGVQKAMQSALAGAIVVNTLLRRPESDDAARRFYRDNLTDACKQHQRWAAAHYATVAARTDSQFWQHRAAGAQLDAPPSLGPDRDLGSHAGTRVELSPQVTFADRPCIDGDFVAVKPVVCHPDLSRPVAYLGGWELAPLLRQLPAGMTPLELAHSWSSRVPLDSGLAIAGWLLGNGILVRQSTGPHNPAQS